ncbi:hypothetical protein LPJ56_001543 [Coemansia sp. RSA 2599]|nr:hypothetical protein LPJ56_001543 [Coemansia sp. RSA 2599]
MIYSTMRLRGPKMDLGLEEEDGPGFSVAEALLGRLGGRRRQRVHSSSDAAAQPVVLAPRSPPVITRVDQPWAQPELELPTLDIEEIIRHRDKYGTGTCVDEQRSPQTPARTSLTDSAQTAVGSECADGPGGRRSTSTAETSEDADTKDEARDRNRVSAASWRLPSVELFVRPLTAMATSGRPSTAMEANKEAGRRRLRHDYFRVATMDGKPTIGSAYRCPIALCQAAFERFEELQTHWNEHPWNRGGILTPVCDGGVRRLGWWEHKRKFFASLVQGMSAPEFPENRDVLHRRRSKSIDEVCRSDYGDISLFGSRTYHVSPRVVPMWQVAQWEAARATK